VADHLPDDDDAATVRVLLAAAGLHPPDDDLRPLATQYGDIRRQLAELWAVDVGEEEPATIYRAGTSAVPGDPR
jgi:hypothetical protein